MLLQSLQISVLSVGTILRNSHYACAFDVMPSGFMRLDQHFVAVVPLDSSICRAMKIGYKKVVLPLFGGSSISSNLAKIPRKWQ